MLQLPESVAAVIQRLRAGGCKVYVVGGAPRDALLDRELRDFDLLVESELHPLRALLPEAVAVGAQAPVLLVRDSSGSQRIEVSGLRSGAHSLAEDLQRRDFTLNALAWDPDSERILDPCGGAEDLRAKRLRSPHPNLGFVEDPVRILRGVRLCQELELEIDEQTGIAMSREAWRLNAAPGERLRDEFFRLLGLELPSCGLEQLRQLGALAALLPELLRLVGIGQNRHHSEDVYQHSLHVCDALPPTPILRMAALLHDVAKPETKQLRSRTDDFSFLRHDLMAGRHLERISRRLRLSGRDQDQIERLVRHHLLFPERLQSDRAIRRMLRRAGRDILPDLLRLRRADLASRERDAQAMVAWEDVERRIRELMQRAQQEAPLAIKGKDIMEAFGIEAGPEVGRWLRRAERYVVEQPEANQRKHLLAWLREARGQ